ncbi:MAG: hypothetical protein DHS20C12_02700 [Pseudohongiella sp.]|nr:MAG: hypothetical protein DHS20C12_02700 [Pseudohongiella sp.]
MLSPADLFSLTMLATGGLYAGMLAYFNGLIGTKRQATRRLWNSEPILWVLMLLLTFAIIFKIVDPAQGQGPGVWYLIGTGNLLVVFIYLVVELARHDLPKAGYWIMAGLAAAAVLYTAATVAIGLATQQMDLQFYKDTLANLLAYISHILLLLLAYNLVRSLGSSLINIWMAEPDSPERLTAGGIAVAAIGNVSNPQGALSQVGVQAGESSTPATLSPDSGLVVDFGVRRIEDHGFKSDLRVICGGENQIINVEVSNDAKTWEACEREDKILTDWDVPYFNSPWRYVRIRNESDQAVDVNEVYDLD